MNAIKICIRSSLEKSTEHRSNRAGEPEQHGSLANLPRRIPRAEHIMDSRIEARSDVGISLVICDNMVGSCILEEAYEES